MKRAHFLACLALAVTASACTNQPVEPGDGDEDVGEATQALSTTVAAGSSGWSVTTDTTDFYNELITTGVLGNTMKASGVVEFTAFAGLADNATNRAKCTNSYAKFFTYKYLSGSWVQWQAPATVYGVVTTFFGSIYSCTASFDSGWTAFGSSTQMDLIEYGYASDGSSTEKWNTSARQ